MKEEKQHCKICGSLDSSFVLETSGVDILSSTMCTLRKCSSCGVFFLGVSHIANERKKVDREEFYQEKQSVLHKLFLFYLGLLMELRARKIERVKKAGDILDVGCGSAWFLKAMQRRGWDCYGVDFSANAIASAKKGNDLTLFCDGFEEAPLAQGSFDAITFWQSFEHMPDPKKTLEKAHTLLRDSGVLFISVPNVESIEARMGLTCWFGFELPRHKFLFSKKTLTRALEESGFTVRSLAMNSLEYNMPMFMMSFFNCIGGESNFLYNYLRRNSYFSAPLLRRAYTIAAIALLFPFVVSASIALIPINILLGTGSVIEVFALKSGKEV